MTDIVDYNAIWRIFRKKHNNPSFNWDDRASSFNKIASATSDEVIRNVEAIGIRPSDTVLDMGAGTGRYAVHLAKKASHLTVLEPSKGMLSFLEENMKDAGITNYSVLNKNFEDVEVGKDLAVHDVVFASNSLGFDDLRAGLEKLDSAAKRVVNILWFAGPSRHIPDPELMKRLGTETVDISMPDYITIAHVLHQMGIYANISVEKVTRKQYYDSPGEAADFWIERGDYSDEEKEIVRDYMEEMLRPEDDGRYSTVRSYRSARIWWEKEANHDEPGV